jgi:putative aldouronate transport system substrate-binding protein
MNKKGFLFLTGLLGLSLAAWGGGQGQNSRTPSTGADTSREAALVYYLWGSEGPANRDILGAINAKLKADINAVLDIKYIDWPEVSTRYPLLFASGEPFDMAHASPTAAAPYYTLAAQGALRDITELLPVVPALKEAIPAATWDGARHGGKIYGVPTLYSEFTPYGYVSNRNLRKKYGLPEINSLETLEAYMDAVVKNERFSPLNGNSNDAGNLYRLMAGHTGRWIDAPGIAFNQLYLVAQDPGNFREIIHPAFTQEFMDWAVRMHEWNARAYWPPDILSAQLSGKDNFNNGNSGGFISHQPDWTGNFGTLQQRQPGVETDFWCPAEGKGKIVRKLGVENSTVISANSKNPERALMAIEKFMTSQAYYELIQYGIRGRQYEVVDGLAIRPPSYRQETDGGGFAVWSLRNDRFNIPYATEDPRRYTLNAAWNRTAINNPYVGFSFDPSRVSTEISAITSVNSQLGIQIMLGKTPEPRAAVERYRSQLTQAGIEKLIAEIKGQMASFTPPVK